MTKGICQPQKSPIISAPPTGTCLVVSSSHLPATHPGPFKRSLFFLGNNSPIATWIASELPGSWWLHLFGRCPWCSNSSHPNLKEPNQRSPLPQPLSSLHRKQRNTKSPQVTSSWGEKNLTVPNLFRTFFLRNLGSHSKKE